MTYFDKRVHNLAEAEDLTQETFTRLFGGKAGRAGLHPGYIFQIAANLLRDRARNNRVRSDKESTVIQRYGESIDWVDPERIAAGKSVILEVLRSLSDLPQRTRAIFILYRIEDIDKNSIAHGFGISASAVEKHLTRATAHLMACARGPGK